MKRILVIAWLGLMLISSMASAFNFTAVGQYEQYPVSGKYRTGTLELSGTWVGGVVILGSNTQNNWVTLTASALSGNGFTSVNTEGYLYLMTRCSAYTSGTIAGTFSMGQGDAGRALVGMTTLWNGTMNIPQTGYSSPLGVSSAASSEVGWSAPLYQATVSSITSSAATVINITSTAGTSAYKQYLVSMAVLSGNNVLWTTNNSSTTPAGLSAVAGKTVYIGEDRYLGPPMEFGGVNTSPHLHLIAPYGSATASVWLVIQGR